jgi:ABC-type Zn uptake system ZnuABC Zn-binding protein ZnuA
MSGLPAVTTGGAAGRARLVLVCVALAVCLVACSGGASAAAGSGLKVVTTTTVFADLVRQVGGSGVSVTSLVPANADVHTFSPSPSQARVLAEARLAFMNGLGLDDWLASTIADIGTNATVVRLAVDLPGVAYIAGTGDEAANPHLWLDVTYAEKYVARIADALATADPTNEATYRANETAYTQRLDALDREVRAQIAAIPEANRRIVSFHDAFPYFARRYGLQIVGVAVEAPGQDPSAGETARLVEAVRNAHVKAIFSEAQFPPRLVDQLAAETGARVVANLYDDSIGDPPLTTYEAIIRWDAAQIAMALA